MKLNTSNWKLCSIGDVVDHIEIHEREPSIRKVTKFVNVSDVGILDLRLRGYTNEEKPSFTRTFKEGQILFAKRWAISTPYPSKIAIADIDGICSPHLWALETKEPLNQQLLPFVLQTNSFFEHANKNSAGSLAGVYLNWDPFSKYQFKLPPKDEQEKILSLFLTLENQIEKTEEQEKNLVALRSKLATELVCIDAQFGNLLHSKNCKPSTLGQIAKETRENTKTPLEEGIVRFVGLEHIESGKLSIQGWGNVADGTTFTKVFQVGDVLFGRRRAYLKKAAQADFKGLCSGDITVLRANEKLILPDLLPYYLSADPVFDFAVSNSAGSLSPRAKWRDLSKYEITLPDLTTQEKILEVFKLLDKNINENRAQFSTLKKLKQKLLDEILG